MNKGRFHISKRKALPWYKAWLIRGIAIVAALLVCAVITMLMTGENPLRVYVTMFEGAFGTSRKVWILLQNMAILDGEPLPAEAKAECDEVWKDLTGDRFKYNR